MKNNLIFTGLHRVTNENTEGLIRGFLHDELGVDYHIEFGISIDSRRVAVTIGELQ